MHQNIEQKCGFKLRSWLHISQWTGNIHIVEAKQTLQEASLRPSAKIRSTAPVISLSKSTLHKKMEILRIRLFSRKLKPALSEQNRKGKLS